MLLGVRARRTPRTSSPWVTGAHRFYERSAFLTLDPSELPGDVPRVAVDDRLYAGAHRARTKERISAATEVEKVMLKPSPRAFGDTWYPPQKSARPRQKSATARLTRR